MKDFFLAIIISLIKIYLTVLALPFYPFWALGKKVNF